MDRNPAEPLMASGSDLASTACSLGGKPELAEDEVACRIAELREEEARWAALEEARKDGSVTVAAGETSTTEPMPAMSVSTASDHHISRLEHRVPPAFEDRSWKVDDALQGRRPTSFTGIAAEVPPAEALRDDHILSAVINVVFDLSLRGTMLHGNSSLKDRIFSRDRKSVV